jgi:hypothetical protein
MENPNFTKGDSLTDKMNVDLNVLRATMLHRIGRHVDGGHIVTVDKCGGVKRTMELLQKLPQPTAFRNSMSDNTILSFRTRA